MTRPQPGSTLFPYTTLFRSGPRRRCSPPPPGRRGVRRCRRRSEEHTSELQSRPHLVCRLLLEKKNRAVLLPAEDGIAPGGATLERRVRAGAVEAGHSARQPP